MSADDAPAPPTDPSRRPTRRVAIAAGLLGLGAAASTRLLRWPGDRAAYVLNLASDGYPTHPLQVRIREAAAAVRERSAGEVEIRTFTGGVLGGNSYQLAQLRSGATDILAQSGSIIGTINPAAALPGLGFAFTDYGEVWRAMDGALGVHIRSVLRGVGLHALPFVWDGGFRHVTTKSSPVRGPADLQGRRIRVPPAPLYASLFEALGASPVPINFPELYSALQSHLVDGEENALPDIAHGKFFEVQSYLAKTSHIWDGYWTLVNGASWARLPDRVRKVIEQCFAAGALAERQDIAEALAGAERSAVVAGMVVNTVDPDPFRKRLRDAGFYAMWKERFGEEAWSVLERFTGKLA